MRQDRKAETGHQSQHLLVIGEYISNDGTVGFLAGAVDQGAHQAAPQSAFLPAIINDQGKLDRLAICAQGVAGSAHLALGAILLATILPGLVLILMGGLQ